MSGLGSLREKVSTLPQHTGKNRSFNTGPGYTVKNILPPDTDVGGFARGMDDLAQILLNSKKEVKFDRNLVTAKGAQYWVAKKNAKLKPGKKPWQYAVQDINGDGAPEVVIVDGEGDIRYINGYHLGKSRHQYNYAYQQFIDSYGTPFQRQVAKALNQIKKKELSQQHFRYANTEIDPNNPDGPLLAKGYLADVGYKPKAPSACNLLLSYFTKFEYKDYVEGVLFKDNEPYQKAFKQLYGVVRANADLYKEMVTEEVNKFFASKGYTEKDAKKKYGGQMSEYSKKSLEIVYSICNNEQNLKDKARAILRRNCDNYNQEYLAGKTLPEKSEYELINPRQYKKDTAPNIGAYIKNYGVRSPTYRQKIHDYYMSPRDQERKQKYSNLMMDVKGYAETQRAGKRAKRAILLPDGKVLMPKAMRDELEQQQQQQQNMTQPEVSE